jgi:hypothetical protein
MESRCLICLSKRKSFLEMGSMMAESSFHILNLSHKNVVLWRGIQNLLSKSRKMCSRWINQTYERYLCTYTFTGLSFWVLILDTPGLRAPTALFWVKGGYKYPLKLSLSWPISNCNTLNSFTHPLYSPLLLVDEIWWGLKEGFKVRAKESASELISHL